MHTQVKAFNPQVFLEFLSYSVFGGLIFHLLNNGNYLNYVTPRMKPYLYFTAIVMLIWALVVLFRLFRPQYKIRSAHCFVLVIPILFLLLPHSALSSADLSTSYTGGGAFKQSTSNNNGVNSLSTPSPASNGTNTPIDAQLGADVSDSAISPPSDTSSADDVGTRLSGIDIENKTITVSNDEFYPWIEEIYTNMDQYVGFTISITGFIYNDPEYLAKDEFVPARLAMVCCAADLLPIGMLCKYNKASELTENSWVTVEGVIRIGQNEGQDEPQITVSKITPAEEVEGYIYPY